MNRIKSYSINFLGVILAAFGIGMFSVPNKIVSGGVSGISTILYYNFKIPAGITYYAINIVLLIIGLKKLSKKFIIRTLISSGLVSLFIDIFSNLPPITNDIVLASFFGGVIFGIGMGPFGAAHSFFGHVFSSFPYASIPSSSRVIPAKRPPPPSGCRRRFGCRWKG